MQNLEDFKFEYKTYSHAKTHIRYHIIFSTKYRRKCLENIKDQVFSSFKYAEKNSEFKILIMNIDQDHIHFLISSKPKYSIDQIVRRMKQLSTRYLYDNCSLYLKKFYWKRNIIWTGGYFCSTIGQVSEKTVEFYIKNQG